MTRNLSSRVARLEELRGSAPRPNGGLQIVVMRDGETRGDAIARAVGEAGGARAAQRAGVLFVPMFDGDLGVL